MLTLKSSIPFFAFTAYFGELLERRVLTNSQFLAKGIELLETKARPQPYG